MGSATDFLAKQTDGTVESLYHEHTAPTGRGQFTLTQRSPTSAPSGTAARGLGLPSSGDALALTRSTESSHRDREWRTGPRSVTRWPCDRVLGGGTCIAAAGGSHHTRVRTSPARRRGWSGGWMSRSAPAGRKGLVGGRGRARMLLANRREGSLGPVLCRQAPRHAESQRMAEGMGQASVDSLGAPRCALGAAPQEASGLVQEHT